ncbi:cellulose synthase [Nonomuraea sp. FMUSA5-5]|uniref:Cellulose synthase n=1 Tax=Nonomuraea composti TaxID=2720023 RepID=A0ABX1B0J9_9ACTN|nr:cellulose synthase [Nonomuraea sp. FMUSA5-5]NJP91380.1 cellulose synthase [Nonomuraea sp. FMUSA5-5]
MGNFEQIAWLPLCAGVTIAGLALAFLAFRRRGAAAGMRVTAWALLPVAAYLTGALQALWTIGTTVVGFVTSLVFNPAVWAGVAVAGLSVVLFVVSGVMRGRKLSLGRRKKGKDDAAPPAQGAAARPAAAAAKPQKPAVAPKPAAKGDDDFSDIEELLKRRGIS